MLRMTRASGAILGLVLVTGCAAPAATSTSAPGSASASARASTAAASPAPTTAIPPPAAAGVPAIPPPVAVSLDTKTTALLVLDMINPTCTTRPACNDSLPAVAALIKKARDAKVPVLYTSTAAANPIVPQLAPAAGEPTIQPTVANKFDSADFEKAVKATNATTVIIVGTRSNGAVLYTAYEANVRGYTVVVAVDGISGAIPFETTMTEFQVLNQPGFTNADNKPLADKLVTLSRGDLITFK
jgi:nicotinamidase-related amidase